MHTSASDASMADNDKPSASDTHTQPHTPSVADPNVQASIAQLCSADDDVVPTVFRWEHGGRDVYITGTFNEWTRQIPMHRSGNDFTYIHNLKRGKHAFKFIVDDEWRFAPDQPTVADIDGRINNFIDVTDFKPYTGDKSFEQEKNAAYYSKPRKRDHPQNMTIVEDDSETPDGNHPINTAIEDPDGEVFTHNMPDLDDYTKDPPPLPPHLRHIILNKPPQLQDTAALPVPQHVALNHLYCTAIRDNMMVLGITQRFKTKFVTTVYYSPELSR
jgi:5'-AMP-activated protein kinase regulatory beta subunit